MLKAAWDKVVYNYQSMRQDSDRIHIQTIDEHIKEAEQGYISYMSIGPMGMGSVAGRVKLTPEEAQTYITESKATRATVVRDMEQRRQKYNLKF